MCYAQRMQHIPLDPPRWRVWLANALVLATLIGFVWLMVWMHQTFTWRWSFGGICGALAMLFAARYFHGIWIMDDKHRIR